MVFSELFGSVVFSDVADCFNRSLLFDLDLYRSLAVLLCTLC